ncbi:DUF4398 domain-containing protein [Rhodospirillum centenum]|uniref:DUF4398 domain-containing protein n=1 Tax=Rhodospirillum centenum (strain ATCC 51521 / SW) TaxID=414684 RepID=B6IU87_RHOCS|nr:DUF4398 domain-containing protein [Rhodospirillum centenum]ACI99964.1 hypothetical protein RC1_2584 [Rhodospirillum centenum SW]
MTRPPLPLSPSVSATPRRRVARLAGPLTAVLLLAACSSTPDTPPPSLSAAQAAIQGVDPQTVNRHAPVEMQQARERLDQAQAAWRDERTEAASRLAEESLAMVRLAQARSNAAEAQAAREDVARTIRTLESEVGLAAGRRAPAGTGTMGTGGMGAGDTGTGSPAGSTGATPVTPPGR